MQEHLFTRQDKFGIIKSESSSKVNGIRDFVDNNKSTEVNFNYFTNPLFNLSTSIYRWLLYRNKIQALQCIVQVYWVQMRGSFCRNRNTCIYTV